MNVWIVIITAGIATYLLRISMLVVAARTGIPRSVQQASQYAVPAAFAALAATSLAGQLTSSSSSVAVAVAVVVGIAAARWYGSAHAAVLAGMPALWLLSALLQSQWP